MGKKLILVLGGARSGKSDTAVQWAKEAGERVLFVATADTLDDDMRERITRHRSTRPEGWHTLEAPIQVGDAIQQTDAPFDVVIVDCITLLASNVLLKLPETASEVEYSEMLMQEIDALMAAYAQSDAVWLIVSNEVGMGIVPPYPLGRLFRDGLGRANQRLAREADQVILMVAGLAWSLKPA
jgi:adenosylcobinamide kinase / adenosylcobinamide-phosphate guanylyltransferase